MTQTLAVGLELLALGAGFFLTLTIIGTGLTALLLPDEGWAMLLAPAVGLAMLTVGFQILTYFIPPAVGAVAVGAAGLILTAVAAFRHRTRLLRDPWPLAGAGLLSISFYAALVQIDIQRGFLTLGGIPSDNIFIYTQAAQYLRDHAVPVFAQAGTALNPGYDALNIVGSNVPSSKGVFVAAAAVLTGLPVYAVFDPVDAIATAVVIGPVWFFTRSALGASWWVPVAASLLLVTNQLLYWVVGNGFQQECLALPMFTAGLGTAMVAIRKRSVAAGALTGLFGGAMVGVYFPMATIFAALAVAGLVACVVAERQFRDPALLRPFASALAVGLLASSGALFAVFRLGLEHWLSRATSNVPAGGVDTFPALPFIMGTLPYAHVWTPTARPYDNLVGPAVPILGALSGVMVFLLIVGVSRAVMWRHAAEASILIAGLAFSAFEVAIAHFPYGYVKSVSYVMPLICVFVAYGALGPAVPGRLEWIRAWARPVGALAVVVLIAVFGVSSRDMILALLARQPTLTRSYLGFSQVDEVIPLGSRVFIDSKASNYEDLVRVAAVAYFLPDRTVRIYVGDFRDGTFTLQTERPQPCAYDYVVSSRQPEGDFVLVDQMLGEGLNVYRRQGGACGGG